MTTKNQQIIEAAKHARWITFWSAIERFSRKIRDHAKEKVDTHTAEQDDLLRSVIMEDNACMQA